MKKLVRFCRFCVAILWHGVRIIIVSKLTNSEDQPIKIARMQSRGGAAICRALRIRVQINGIVPQEKPMLLVCNHPGVLDAWILSARFVTSFVAKAELERWPVFGPIGRACGLIFVDRESRMRTSDLVERIQDRMRAGVAVFVFPEGTTSGDDTILPFKTGVFAAVEKMRGAIVLPMYMWAEKMDGSYSDENTRKKIFWRRGESLLDHAKDLLKIKTTDIEILVGTPISTEGCDRKYLAHAAQRQLELLDRATRSTEIDSFLD